MVETIASTSLVIHRPLCGGCKVRYSVYMRKSSHSSRFRSIGMVGRSAVLNPCLPREGFERRVVNMGSIKAAMELTKEVYSHKEKGRISRTWKYRIDDDSDLRPGIWAPVNRADDPSLHNPLLRQERLGSGWVGAVFEWEGVIIDDNPALEKQAWLALSQEEGRPSPQTFVLKRTEGMKNEQAISEVLCWSRDPSQMKRLASRKEEIYQSLQGGVYNLRPGSREFVDVLMTYNIPMALVSVRPRKTLENAIRDIGMEGVFSVVVASEDVHRGKPDPEMFIYAAQLLNFIPERCIIFGNSNQTVEAAHDARMKCVAVASKHPVYELGAADLVVRYLDELSVVDLKNLAAVESPEFQTPELELEMEEEEDQYEPKATAVEDNFW